MLVLIHYVEMTLKMRVYVWYLDGMTIYFKCPDLPNAGESWGSQLEKYGQVSIDATAESVGPSCVQSLIYNQAT